MNNSSYYTDMIKKQIESIPNDSNIILSKDDFNALTKFIQDVLEEFWNDHINGTAQMNNEEEEKVIKVAIKEYMEHKQNNMRSNNSEVVEHNQMNDCNDNDNTSNSRDTDQHVDKIRNNIDSDSDRNSNSISLIATDTSCDINNDFRQSMDIEYPSNDGKDADADTDIGNAMDDAIDVGSSG